MKHEVAVLPEVISYYLWVQQKKMTDDNEKMNSMKGSNLCPLRDVLSE